MNIHEFKNELVGFSDPFSSHRFEGLGLADLLDLLDKLNSVARSILDRIDIPANGGSEGDSVKVIGGGKVTVKEVGLGESIKPEGEAAPAYVKVEGDDDFTEEFLYEFRKHVPKDWDVRIANGRLEVREWAGRPGPLFNFDIRRHDSFELIVGIPEIVGAMMTQMHRDFIEIREFAEEAVAGCTAPGELAAAVVAKAKSMPISWELSKRIEDAFPGEIVRNVPKDETKS